MKFRLFIIAALAALYIPASAGATTLVYPGGAPAEKWQWAADMNRMPGPLPVIGVVPDDCPGFPGWLARTKVEGCAANGAIGFRTVGLTASRIREIMMHEFGHLFSRRMPSWMHEEFADVTRQPYNDELFADSYSLCAIRKYPWKSYVSFNGVKVGTLHDWGRICSGIRAAAIGMR